MGRNETRLGRLSAGLTAQERALLVLRSWKDGEEEDYAWRWQMPEDQAPEFNRLIALMNAVNSELKPFLIVLMLETEKLSLRLGCLGVLALWNRQAVEIEGFLEHCGADSGRHLWLRDGLKHAPMLPVIHLGPEYARIAADENARREPNRLDEAVALHKDALREGIAAQWQQLIAVELVVDEVRCAFGGEDPRLPQVCEIMQRARQELEDVREHAQRYLGPLPLPEPDAEIVDRLRAFVLHEVAS